MVCSCVHTMLIYFYTTIPRTQLRTHDAHLFVHSYYSESNLFLFAYITPFPYRRRPKFWHMWLASTSTCTLHILPKLERIGSAVLNYFQVPCVNAAYYLCLDNARVHEWTALWEINPVVDNLSKKGKWFEVCNIFVFKIKVLFSIVDRIGSAVLTHHWCVCVHCACYPKQKIGLQHFCF